MRILLCEDEPSLSRALVKIFEKNHFSADAVYNGQEALDYLACASYDAVVMDVMMPVMDGITALCHLRRRGDTTPVLLLTAKAEVADRVCGLDSGANYYLTKPFAADELLAALRVITRRQSDGDSRLGLGNVLLDRATFELSSPFGSFRLANREYQIMELLLSNPHHVFSAERLFERIWGPDSDAELNVVWVYISYLRKKLTALKASVHIRATRGIGYSLEEVEA